MRGQGRDGTDAAHVQIPRILPRIPTFTITPSKRLTYPTTRHTLLDVWRKPCMVMPNAARNPVLQ